MVIRPLWKYDLFHKKSILSTSVCCNKDTEPPKRPFLPGLKLDEAGSKDKTSVHSCILLVDIARSWCNGSRVGMPIHLVAGSPVLTTHLVDMDSRIRPACMGCSGQAVGPPITPDHQYPHRLTALTKNWLNEQELYPLTDEPAIMNRVDVSVTNHH